MTRLRRETRAEFLLFVHTRQALVALLVLAAGVVLSYTSSRNNVVSSVRFFEERAARFAQEGVRLEDALAAPTRVTSSAGGSETIENPLKYYFLQLSESVRAVEPGPMAATALDFTTFIVIPLLFLYLGTRVALVDRTAGTVGFRAARERWSTIVTAKVIVLAVAGTLAAVTTAAAGWAVAGIGQVVAGSVRDDVRYALAAPEEHALWLKIALTALIATVFGLAGYLLGAVSGSSSWPLVLSALVLFMAPFAGSWDPRNVMAVFGSRVYDFWGQFELRPPLALEPGAAGVLALVYYFIVLTGIVLTSRRIPL